MVWFVPLVQGHQTRLHWGWAHADGVHRARYFYPSCRIISLEANDKILAILEKRRRKKRFFDLIIVLI
jgi:hypothetical protein